jgi:hypothetical protein
MKARTRWRIGPLEFTGGPATVLVVMLVIVLCICGPCVVGTLAL